MYISIDKRKLTEKEQNILLVLDVIIGHEVLSTIELARQTGLSASTISRVLHLLFERGLLQDMGKEETLKGRYPQRVGLNKRCGVLMHLSIDHDAINGYLSDLDCKILIRARRGIRNDTALDHVLGPIQSIFRKFSSYAHEQGTEILAVSVCLPGTVNRQQKRIQNIPDVCQFTDINLFETIERLTGLPVYINNASMMAAAGEHIQNYPHTMNLVYLNVQRHIGIGAGLIINGELVNGADNYAGEVGSMLLSSAATTRSRRTRAGQMEEQAGIRALFDRLEQKMQQGSCLQLKQLLQKSKSHRLELALLEQAIEQGDNEAQEVYDEVLRLWAVLIINVNLVVNPDLFILGGAITPENHFTLRRLRLFIEEACVFYPRLEAGTLKEMAPVTGALHTLRNYVFNEILSNKAIESEVGFK